MKELQRARVKLQRSKLTKSGLNKYAGFRYFELGDFLPTINEINLELGLFTHFYIKEEKAYLDVKSEKETVTFVCPLVNSEIKGTTAIQQLGGTITYLRRYLFLMAYEIIENDVQDAVMKKPVEQVPVAEKKEYPVTDKPISQAQLNMLLAIINKKGLDKESFKAKFEITKSVKELTQAEFQPILKKLNFMQEVKNEVQK